MGAMGNADGSQRILAVPEQVLDRIERSQGLLPGSPSEVGRGPIAIRGLAGALTLAKAPAHLGTGLA